MAGQILWCHDRWDHINSGLCLGLSLWPKSKITFFNLIAIFKIVVLVDIILYFWELIICCNWWLILIQFFNTSSSIVCVFKISHCNITSLLLRHIVCFLIIFKIQLRNNFILYINITLFIPAQNYTLMLF
jgi:hypothetical protein